MKRHSRGYEAVGTTALPIAHFLGAIMKRRLRGYGPSGRRRYQSLTPLSPTQKAGEDEAGDKHECAERQCGQAERGQLLAKIALDARTK